MLYKTHRDDLSKSLTDSISKAHNPMVFDFILTAFVFAGFWIVIFRENLVPQNFSFDGNRIQALASESIAGSGDSSYETVARIYNLFGLGTQPLLASILGYCAFVATVLAVRLRYRHLKPTISAIYLYLVGILLGAVYLGFYSKDLFVLPIVLVLLFSRFSRLGQASLFALMVLYGLNFRSYWLVVLLVFLALRMIRFTRRSLFLQVVIAMATVAIISLGLSVVTGYEPDYFRQAANLYREGSANATTAIHRFVEFQQPWGGVINNALTLVSLVFPVPLFLIGQPLYIAIGFGIAAMWLVFLRSMREPNLLLSKASNLSSLLLVSFLIVQALFEPDYGSALRHVTPFIAVLIALHLSGEEVVRAQDE